MGGSSRTINAQGRGTAKALQHLAPEAFGLRKILPLEPVDIVAIGPTRWQGQVLSLHRRLIAGEDLVEEGGDAPAIEQEVVEAPGDVNSLLSQAVNSEAQQRSLPQVKTLSSIRLQPLLNMLALLLCRQMAPVVLLVGQHNLGAHHLHWSVQAFPDEEGAQDGMLVKHLLPGCLEGRTIERLA